MRVYSTTEGNIKMPRRRLGETPKHLKKYYKFNFKPSINHD